MSEQWIADLVELAARADAVRRDTIALLERIAEVDGDIPASVVHRMAMLSLDATLVDWVRREHFRKLGQPLPQQPAPVAAARSRDAEIDALPAGDEGALLAFVRRVIEEDGDLTTSLVHHLAMVGPMPRAHQKAERERARWFRERGLPLPEMPGPRDLE